MAKCKGQSDIGVNISAVYYKGVVLSGKISVYPQTTVLHFVKCVSSRCYKCIEQTFFTLK